MVEENNKSIIFLKIIKVVICAFLFFEFCKIIILPNVFFSSSEINYSRGTILVALKELQILNIDKLIKFDTNRKFRFVSANTSMSFEFDYDGVEDKVKPYYLEQAKKKNWKVIKVNDNEIILEKQRDKNLVHLDFQKQKDNIWLLNASYTIIMK